MDSHSQYMQYVLDLAVKGRGHVSPNPLVGCIIVKNGKIIGEGYHQSFGGNHAEVEAFNNCIEDPEGADLYVNLEPCSIFSKTPPCTEKIIHSGIKNVYIGTLDTNPEINGSGVEQLKINNINVYDGILENECKEINLGFFNWVTKKKPYVIAKIAETKDGYIGTSSKQLWITGDDSNKNVHNLRSKVDAILIGRKTAEIDNPSLTVRKVLGNNPTRIILDTTRKLPLDLKIFNDSESKNIVYCSKRIFSDSKTTFCNYLTVDESNGILDLNEVLLSLGEQGITSVLVEGGREVLSSFLSEDLIDEIHLFTSDKTFDEADIKNPIVIDDKWDILDNQRLEKDKLIIARKKELCLQG